MHVWEGQTLILSRTCANTICSSKWLFPDTVSKSVMFLASKSCLLNLQYLVTSLASEQQLCRICPSSGLQHFRGSFWINIKVWTFLASLVATLPSPLEGAGKVHWMKYSASKVCNVGWNLLTIPTFSHFFKTFELEFAYNIDLFTFHEMDFAFNIDFFTFLDPPHLLTQDNCAV